jgi:hypothetical protein
MALKYAQRPTSRYTLIPAAPVVTGVLKTSTLRCRIKRDPVGPQSAGMAGP